MPAPVPALVIFDCDSTLSSIEGVDELAARKGRGREVSELTAAAMAGTVALEEVYGRRLDLIRPHSSDLDWLGRRYVQSIVPGARETVEVLQSLGRDVHIISGGFLQAVSSLAVVLRIPSGNVHAVELKFDAGGAYCGFAADSPLTRSGGKAAVCRKIMQGRRDAVAVGDGVTDLEMQEAGARVIGFGGVVVRPEVRDRAAAYVTGATLLDVLPHLLTAAEREQQRAG